MALAPFGPPLIPSIRVQIALVAPAVEDGMQCTGIVSCSLTESGRMTVSPCRRRLKAAAGFGLVELLVAIVVFAVVASIAAPSFQSMQVSADLRSTSSDLQSAIILARTQAVTLRVDVDLSPHGRGWSDGWLLEYNWPAGAPRIEEDVLVSRSGTVDIVGPPGSLRFLPSGIIREGASRFELCRSGAGRAIDVSPLGRVAITEQSC